MFTKVQGNSFTAILVYVDDLLVGGNDMQIIEETKEFMASPFYMKDLGSLRYFLGLDIDLTAQGYFLSQEISSRYSHSLQHVSLQALKLPMDSHLKMTVDLGEPFLIQQNINSFLESLFTLLSLGLI